MRELVVRAPCACSAQELWALREDLEFDHYCGKLDGQMFVMESKEVFLSEGEPMIKRWFKLQHYVNPIPKVIRKQLGVKQEFSVKVQSQWFKCLHDEGHALKFWVRTPVMPDRFKIHGTQWVERVDDHNCLQCARIHIAAKVPGLAQVLEKGIEKGMKKAYEELPTRVIDFLALRKDKGVPYPDPFNPFTSGPTPYPLHTSAATVEETAHSLTPIDDSLGDDASDDSPSTPSPPPLSPADAPGSASPSLATSTADCTPAPLPSIHPCRVSHGSEAAATATTPAVEIASLTPPPPQGASSVTPERSPSCDVSVAAATEARPSRVGCTHDQPDSCGAATVAAQLTVTETERSAATPADATKTSAGQQGLVPPASAATLSAWAARPVSEETVAGASRNVRLAHLRETIDSRRAALHAAELEYAMEAAREEVAHEMQQLEGMLRRERELSTRLNREVNQLEARLAREMKQLRAELALEKRRTRELRQALAAAKEHAHGEHAQGEHAADEMANGGVAHATAHAAEGRDSLAAWETYDASQPALAQRQLADTAVIESAIMNAISHARASKATSTKFVYPTGA